MLGIVFSEFLEMVEDNFGADMADDIIDDTNPASGGAYTTVGKYDHTEIVALVVALSKRTETPVDDLVRFFGSHLLGRFAERYPDFFNSKSNLFDFLESVDGYIHVEVLKLYPDAELPKFVSERKGENTLVLTYTSSRPFGNLAYGLIDGTMKHYNQPGQILMEDLSGEAANSVQFTITTDG